MAREARSWQISPLDAAALVDGAPFPLAHWPEVRLGVNEADYLERIHSDVVAHDRAVRNTAKGSKPPPERIRPSDRKWYRGLVREAEGLPELKPRPDAAAGPQADPPPPEENVENVPISEEEWAEIIAAREERNAG